MCHVRRANSTFSDPGITHRFLGARGADQRLKAYESLDARQKKWVQACVVDDGLREWLAPQDASAIARMIALSDDLGRGAFMNPRRTVLAPLGGGGGGWGRWTVPNDVPNDIKALCDQKWKTLSWKDKLYLRQSVIGMMAGWEQFVANVNHDTQLIDG